MPEEVRNQLGIDRAMTAGVEDMNRRLGQKELLGTMIDENDLDGFIRGASREGLLRLKEYYQKNTSRFGGMLPAYVEGQIDSAIARLSKPVGTKRGGLALGRTGSDGAMLTPDGEDDERLAEDAYQRFELMAKIMFNDQKRILLEMLGEEYVYNEEERGLVFTHRQTDEFFVLERIGPVTRFVFNSDEQYRFILSAIVRYRARPEVEFSYQVFYNKPDDNFFLNLSIPRRSTNEQPRELTPEAFLDLLRSGEMINRETATLTSAEVGDALKFVDAYRKYLKSVLDIEVAPSEQIGLTEASALLRIEEDYRYVSPMDMDPEELAVNNIITRFFYPEGYDIGHSRVIHALERIISEKLDSFFQPRLNRQVRVIYSKGEDNIFGLEGRLVGYRAENGRLRIELQNDDQVQEHSFYIQNQNRRDAALGHLVQVQLTGIADGAMMVPERVGGIDFNPNEMNLREQGLGVNFTIDDSLLESIKPEAVYGIQPIIINITPVTNFLPLLGLSENDPQPRLSYLQ